MKDGYRFVDCDMHIMEPIDLFDKYLDPAFKHRVTSSHRRQDGGSTGMRGRPLWFFDGQPTSNDGNISQYNRIRGPLVGARANKTVMFAVERGYDAEAQVIGMEMEGIDIAVLFPTAGLSFLARDNMDPQLSNAICRAYNDWLHDFCQQAPARLKWTLVANMRDVPSGVAELKYWAERDPNLVGVYLSPQAPGGKLLDNPDLHPLYDAAQSLDLPLLAHGGTARPPYGPGTRNLDGAWFLLHGISNPWAGMVAMGALIGGGIFDLFPRIRAAIIETAGGWLPAALDRFDTHYLMSPGHVPNLKRMPCEVIAEGRYFHGIDSWERSVEFCADELGEDMWLFASDWPHGDTAWPEAVQQTVERPRLSESGRRKILGESALRLCPRLLG